MNRTRVIFFAVVLACGNSLNSHGTPPQEMAYMFDTNAKVIVVPGSIGSRKVNMVIDTGASYNLFGNHLKPVLTGELRKVRSSREKSSSIDVEIGQYQSLSILGIRDESGAECLVMDISRVSAAASLELDGIVGIPFLLDRILELDFDNGIVRISSVRHKVAKNERPMVLDRMFRPYINIELEGETIAFLIDTGNSGACDIEADLFDTLSAASIIEIVGLGRHTGLTDEDKWSENQVGLLKSCEIYGNTLSNIPVTRGKRNTVGLELIKRFHVSLDYVNRSFEFEPGKLFNSQIPLPTIFKTASVSK